MFITFEGIDGSGKTTQSRLLAAHLREQGHNVLLTREPGGTEIGDQIRTILLDNLNNTDMQPRTELLLFCASRAQLVGQVIRPHLARGGIVICDRYADSTLAYQGYGHGLPVDELKQILRFATGGLRPDRTIYLDLRPEDGLQRRRAGMLFGADWNRLDDMELDFHRRVYEGYAALRREEPARWLVVDASAPSEAVQEALRRALQPHLPQKERPGD